jgi:hypothetical protein
MLNSEYMRQISVKYNFKSKHKTTTILKSNSLKELKEKIESEIKFTLSKMKLLYNKNNIILNNENYDLKADIYSVGIIMFIW